MHVRSTSFIAATALVVAALGGLSASARGQSVGNHAIDWNAIASTSIIATAGQPPGAAALSLAMVQGAVYDAVNGIDGGHTPYLGSPAGADASDSKEAAVAAAAYNVLKSLFPAQQGTLEGLYNASLAHIQDGGAKAGGIEVGQAAAAAMLDARRDDGRGAPFSPVFGTEPGQFRLAPPQGPTGIVARDPAAWVGNVRPFLVPNVEMLRSEGPPALTSAAYTADFNEVKEVGSLTSTRRTADQTAASIFWQDHGIAIWNRVFRSLATSEGLDVVDSARLLAMANLAGADALIGCWKDKYYWNFWRPITAIREAATDGNPATEADPGWLPLFDPSVLVSGPPLVTPGFPDHPSGHTCASGAIVRTLSAFFGTDKIAFTASSNKCAPAPCAPRRFERFSDALKEVIDARVWSGIHFRTADVQGAVLGKKVAHYLEKHFIQPVGATAYLRALHFRSEGLNRLHRLGRYAQTTR